MDMTPEKLAFIKGEATKPLEAKPEKVVDVAPPPEPLAPVKETTPRSPRRSTRRISHETPDAYQVLDQVLVPVTIRLPHRTAQTLRRAYLEQRLKHAKPDTQQEIVEDAITDWLSRHGFFE